MAVLGLWRCVNIFGDGVRHRHLVPLLADVLHHLMALLADTLLRHDDGLGPAPQLHGAVADLLGHLQGRPVTLPLQPVAALRLYLVPDLGHLDGGADPVLDLLAHLPSPGLVAGGGAAGLDAVGLPSLPTHLLGDGASVGRGSIAATDPRGRH